MRLLTKTSLLIITVSIFIFLIGNIFFFQVLKGMLNDHVQDELVLQMHELVSEIRKNGMTSQRVVYKDNLAIKKLNSDTQARFSIKDTVFFNDIQQQFVPHKILSFSIKSDNQLYLLTIHKSMLSSNKLIEKITIASIFMVFIFLIGIYTLNRFIFANVWADFFKNLKLISQYKIGSRKELTLIDSEVNEFALLNSVLEQMVAKIQKDFITLKELTENTSHELQTPMAVIKGKAEMLLQSENFSEKEMDLIYGIIKTSDQLAKLNQSLLLISKIDNDQYEESEPVNLKVVVSKFLEHFEMMIQAGEFHLSVSTFDKMVQINPTLLDVLVSNLLINSILHNKQKGKLEITIVQNKLVVANTGAMEKLDSEKIFIRFSKKSKDQKRTGLGLEIVKKICDYYALPIVYYYQNEMHFFAVDFESVLLPE